MKLLRLLLLILVSGGTASPSFGDEGAEGKRQFAAWVESFAIDRPWEVFSEATPGIEPRHRGALAHVVARLNQGGIPEAAVDHLHEDLGTLLKFQGQEIRERLPAHGDYQQFFQVDVFRLWQQLLSERDLPERWHSGFREAYFSRALGTGVPFDVRMPPEIDGRKRYPLVVVIKAGLRVDPSEAFPFIEVKPQGGGIWGYRSMSTVDAMSVIAFMKRHYPVDPDRIYLAGFSAGASGAMHLASCHPDTFAAVMPLVAVGTDYPIANFRALPVAMHHGTNDWTSAICNVRVQFQRMNRLGCPAILREYEGVGHSVPRPHEPLMTWFFEQKRLRAPHSIMHECETPSLGRARWLQIHEFRDPHRRASVVASVEDGTVTIRAVNVEALTVDLDGLPAEAGPAERIAINEARLPVEKPAGKQVRLRFSRDEKSGPGYWRWADDENPAPPARRPYEAGAAANLFQGEPLVVVYGTANPDRVPLLKSAAKSLAACGGPVFQKMRPPHFPVVADTALSPEQEANCNLLLVGTAEENTVTRKLLPALPLKIRDGNLMAGDREPLPLRDQVLSLVHPHPDHPGRLVCLLAPFTDREGLATFGKAPQKYLAGPNGFDRVSQADLLVRNLDFGIGRQMQFGKDWQWIAMPGAEVPLPERFRKRENLSRAHMAVMQRTPGAEFSLWWGPADRGMWGTDFNFLKRYNPDTATEADLRIEHRIVETIIGTVSGAELEEIWNRWGKNRELLSLPEISIDELEDEKSYRVHIPMDLYIKLGQRKKNLTDPEPGPSIAFEDVMTEIFP